MLSARALSTTAFLRGPGGSDSRPEGSTATSATFNKREKAAEDMYVQEKEKEMYRKMAQALKAQKEKLEADGVNTAELEKEAQKP